MSSTHLLLLAAGEGQRLRPLTADRPKCLVGFRGKPILDYILRAAEISGISRAMIHVVSGYQHEVLEAFLQGQGPVTVHHNGKFSVANMLSSLDTGLQAIPDATDVVVSYTDIIYRPEVLKELLNCDRELCLIADRDWKQLWECRMEDPLKDAETFLTRPAGNLDDIGRRPRRSEDIEAQYVGLLRFRGAGLIVVRELLGFLREKVQESYCRSYMTDLIQMLIRMHHPVAPVYIHGGWLEIDTLDDLKNLTHDPRFHFSF